MTQFCVGDEMPINKQGRADTRAQGDDEDHPLAPLACSEAHLSIASSIRIVEDGHRTTGRFLEQLLRLTAKPFLRHMRGRTHLPTPDSGRETTPDGAVPGEMGCDFGDCRAHGCRCRRRWREQAKALSEQPSGERVDWRALNACSTNVNA